VLVTLAVKASNGSQLSLNLSDILQTGSTSVPRDTSTETTNRLAINTGSDVIGAQHVQRDNTEPKDEIVKAESPRVEAELVETIDDDDSVEEYIDRSVAPRLIPILIPPFWYDDAYKTPRLVLDIVKKKICASMRYFQPYPSSVLIGICRIRANWHRIKMNCIPKHLFEILVPLQFSKIQPCPEFRPNSKVTLLVITEQQFSVALGWELQTFHKPISYYGSPFLAKVPKIIIKHSATSNKLEFIYIVDVYHNAN